MGGQNNANGKVSNTQRGDEPTNGFKTTSSIFIAFIHVLECVRLVGYYSKLEKPAVLKKMKALETYFTLGTPEHPIKVKWCLYMVIVEAVEDAWPDVEDDKSSFEFS